MPSKSRPSRLKQPKLTLSAAGLAALTAGVGTYVWQQQGRKRNKRKANNAHRNSIKFSQAEYERALQLLKQKDDEIDMLQEWMTKHGATWRE